MRTTAVAVTVLCWLATACGGGPAPSPPATAAPEPTATVRPPLAWLPDGTGIRLELAITPEERERGLMFRTSLPPDHGMLFLFERPARWTFWMKDTWIPLDLVFLDGSGTVVDTVASAAPCRAEPCPQYAPAADAMAVLELAAGTAAAHGVEPGTRLRFERVPGYPRE